MISNQEPTLLYGRVSGAIVPIGTLEVGSGGQLILLSSDGIGGIPIYDPINKTYRNLTAPNGVLSLSAGA